MTANEFFSWWSARLAELVPESLQNLRPNSGTDIEVRLQGDSLQFSAPTKHTAIRFQLAAGNTGGQPEPLSGSLSDLPRAPQRIRLTLGHEDFLLRELSLPRAARGNLAEAVSYQLPQLTPFAADQLLYACGEMPDPSPEGPLSVWLVAFPRQRIGQALALIDQPVPDNPLPLKKPPLAGETLDLSWRVAEKPLSTRRRLAWLGLVVLWVAVFALHMHNRQQEQGQLDAELREISGRATEVGQLRERISNVRQQAKWLAQHRQSSRSPLALIDALTQKLDDQTWIQGLDLRGQRLTLRGISASPATLIGTLEATALLKDVQFDAATTRDGGGQGDRFNISARLEAPEREDGT